MSYDLVIFFNYCPDFNSIKFRRVACDYGSYIKLVSCMIWLLVCFTVTVISPTLAGLLSN
ncbi:hypothetical protein E2542_SST29953 [Spatholobus suberectus]|nr:hypothetical protein E2542_SST29953 [Spatholobus suberectus]